VADQLHPLELEGVEERHRIGGERLRVVPAPGRARPAEAAQVGADQPMAVRQTRDHVAPAPEVLRPAVQHQHGLAGSGLGAVHAQPAHVGGLDLDVAVLDARDVGRA
jgi:hypothetical protein